MGDESVSLRIFQPNVIWLHHPRLRLKKGLKDKGIWSREDEIFPQWDLHEYHLPSSLPVMNGKLERHATPYPLSLCKISKEQSLKNQKIPSMFFKDKGRMSYSTYMYCDVVKFKRYLIYHKVDVHNFSFSLKKASGVQLGVNLRTNMKDSCVRKKLEYVIKFCSPFQTW